MRIGILTYRIFSVLLFVLVVVAIWLATDGQWTQATAAVGAMVAIAIGQALMLRCQHCSSRPGLRLLALWTIPFGWEVYLADALFLRHCPRCHKSLSQAKEPSGAV
jgi:hypothetical protein